MKTNLLILTALFFLLSANAQETTNAGKPAPEARFGLKGGLNIANMVKSSDGNFSSNSLLGFNGGGLLILPLGGIIALQPEVLFSQKGYHASGSSLFGSYDYRRFVNCLDVPLLLRLNVSGSFAIVAGPQYSYLLSTHTSFRSGDASYKQTVNNENDNIRKNIFGGAIGADINLGDNLFLYGRYTIDFKNNNGDGTSSTPAYKNQVIQFGLGVAF
jgi:hypothetical protein